MSGNYTSEPDERTLRIPARGNLYTSRKRRLSEVGALISGGAGRDIGGPASNSKNSISPKERCPGIIPQSQTSELYEPLRTEIGYDS